MHLSGVNVDCNFQNLTWHAVSLTAVILQLLPWAFSIPYKQSAQDSLKDFATECLWYFPAKLEFFCCGVLKQYMKGLYVLAIKKSFKLRKESNIISERVDERGCELDRVGKVGHAAPEGNEQ